MDNDSRYAAALLTIPFFIVIIAALYVVDLDAVFEPPYLLFILNTVFLGLIPLYIAYISFRTYRKTKNLPLVLLGSGMLVMGICSIVAGWTVDLPDGPDITVTIHNTAFFAGSVLAMAASIDSLDLRLLGEQPLRTRHGVALYAAALVFSFILIATALAGLLPPFFLPESGATPLRQAILSGSILLFAIAAIHFFITGARRKTDFFRWFSLGLGLIAIGLGAVFFQPSVGSAMGWAGRAVQYLGACCALIAILSARKNAAEHGISVEDLIARFFSQAETGYRRLIETAPNAIIVFSPGGRIILCNPAAERIFLYSRDEIVGKNFSGLIPDIGSLAAGEADTQNQGTNRESPPIARSFESGAVRRDGKKIPVELTVSRNQVDGIWITTCIIRDLSERKKAEEALRENESLLQSFFDAPGNMRGIVDVIADDDIRHINDNTVTSGFVGLTPGGMRNKTGSELGEPREIRALWVSRYRESQRSGNPVTFKYRDQRENSDAWLEATVTYLGTADTGFPRFAYVVSDVTDREQTEKALSENRALLQMILDGIPDPVFFKDTQSRILMANPATLALIGKPAEEVIGKDDLNHYADPAIGRAIMQNDRRIMASGVPETVEETALSPAGYRTYLSSKLPVRDSEGRVTGLLGIATDITDRKHAENALRESEEKFRALIETTSDFIWEVDPQGRYTYCSPQMERLWGMIPEEMIGKTPFDLMPEGEKEQAIRFFSKLAESKQPFSGLITSSIVPSGRITWIETSGIPFSDEKGKLVGYRGISRDITERREADSALRLKQAEIQALFENIPAGIVLFDAGPSYEVLVHNRYYQELFAEPFRSKGMAGLSVYDFAPDVQGSGIIPVLDEIVATQRPKQFLDFPYRSDVQNDRWFNWYISPIIIDGRVISLVSLSIDVTDRYNAEAALRRSEEQLRGDLDAVRMLQNIGTIYLHARNLETVLNEIVEAAIAITHADFGNIQLVDPETGDLRIAAHRGFPDWWLEYWNTVSRGRGSCGTVVERGERVFVENVEQSPIFAGSPALEVQLRAGIRAVQSTPLVSREGNLLGMVSTHFRAPGRPDERALGLLDLLARQAADIIERSRSENALRTTYDLMAAQEAELRTSNEELSRRQQELSVALQEKEALLSEVHHRVKNNLASFISLLALDGSYDRSPQGIAMRNDLQNRARSMSLIHDILYKTHNFSTVDMQLYLSTLVQQVVGSYRLDQDVGYTVETHDQTLDLQRATPVGLIVNELVTNSLKYAFPAGPGPGSLPDSACLISISLEREDGMYLLTIRDNGVGLPTGFDPHVSKSLGLKLVNFLARHQLRGTVAFDSGSIGLQCRITFPEKN